MHSIIVFASGKGTNAAAIINYFRHTAIAKVALIVTNKETAGVLDIARAENIPFIVVSNAALGEPPLAEELKKYNASLIVLAGFLRKIPATITEAFPNRIINIHPALLPAYGGKGMYGNNVHQAVIAAGEAESGITVHYVNEKYDEGNIILQARCPVVPGCNAETLAESIHQLEHFYYPRVIEFLLTFRNHQNKYSHG
ncbi:phosphoribosylglycinamide formyltransferase [Chitinophagaceae bacterium MMS25-I14]